MLKKFYVKCGDSSTIILGEDHFDAAVRAFKRFRDADSPPALGALVGISERTFNILEYNDEDCFFFTPIVMKKAGVCDLYNMDVPETE